MKDIILDTLIDGVKLLPFLFITFLLMELIEHKFGDKLNKKLTKVNKVGPLLGGLLGIIPQCGISASTAATMSAAIEDENFLNEMLLFTLLPYVQRVLGKNPYNCSKRLQRYAGESGRSLKKEILMRWFG